METQSFFIGASLFVGCVVFIASTFFLYKEDILAWYIALWNVWQRDDYIEENREKLMNDLRENELIVYVDEELDAAHLKKEQEFRRQGRRYLFYLEKSYEVAILKGHGLLFDLRAVKKLQYMFWLPRCMLLRHVIDVGDANVMKEVERFIYERVIGHLTIDRESRPKERKKMMEALAAEQDTTHTILHNK